MTSPFYTNLEKFKGIVMQIEKGPINDRFALKVDYFLTVFIFFFVYIQNFTAQLLKN